MSKRLQVVMDDQELRDVQRAARRRGVTVAEWVRSTLRAARNELPHGDPAKKLQVVRAAARNSFPTADIDEMLAEIERGYGGAS